MPQAINQMKSKLLLIKLISAMQTKGICSDNNPWEIWQDIH